MSKIRLKPELLTLLSSDAMGCFTAPELTSAYLKLPEMKGLERRLAAQFIQRNIKRLCTRGFLVPTGQVIGHSPQYQLNTKLSASNVSVSSPHARNIAPAKESGNSFDKRLHIKISQYKVELLTALGEAEEYEALCHETPDKAELLQELYNEARDRYSKNLGRIRALEALMAQQQAQIC